MAGLAGLAEQVRPVALAREQRLAVLPALASLFPEGLRRGSTVAVVGQPGAGGGTSLALALVAEASRTGAWVATVGLPSLGLVAADELGVALGRLVLVAAPERAAWAGVTAALLDGFDCLVLDASRCGRRGDARRVVARARERGTVIVALGTGWPEPCDVELRVAQARWQGIGDGHGHLRARKVRVARTGRGEAARPLLVDLWLPGSSGQVEAAVTFDGSRGVEAEPAEAVEAGPAAPVEPASTTSVVPLRAVG